MQKISTFQELDESQVDNKKKMEGLTQNYPSI